MNFRKTRYDDEPEINLIPLIDVLLVILIFLAATTSFNRYQQLKLSLPRATGEATQQDAMHVAVSHDGLYAVEGQLLPGTTSAELADALRQLTAARAKGTTHPDEQAQADGSSEPVLVIDADAQASHAAVVRVMEAARQAGIERIHFTTQASP